MNNMEYFEILFGALLGFSFTLLIQLINWLIKKWKANKLLKLEFPEIQKFLISYTTAYEMEFYGISNTPIPYFELISNPNEILYLDETKRVLVYKMNTNIKAAENLRLLAIPLINNPEREVELNLYGKIYNDYLKAAKDDGEKLKKKI